MALVLDNSVTIAWLTTEETTEAIEDVFNKIALDGACAPPIWLLEVGNVLCLQERYKKITAEMRQSSVQKLKKFEIAIDMESLDYAWTATLHLARHFKLTMYDASYLELASRKNLPLATLDKELRFAAASMNIVLLGI